MNGKFIWTSGMEIVAVFNSLRNNIRREVVYRIFKWTLLMELLSDNPGGRVPRIGNIGGELFSKSCFYFYLASEGPGEKVMA